MNGAQVGVLKQANKVGLRGLLEGHDGGALEAKVGLEILRNLTNQTLERELADEKLGRLLKLADLTKGNGSRPVTVRLFDTTGGGGRLASGLGGQLLARGFTSSGLAGGLLGTGHC